MTERLRVLFLCTGDSARSQIAEALLRAMTHGRADVHSAGTHPQPEVHPTARKTLATHFNPERIHWSFADPAAVEGSDEERQHEFDKTAADIAGRLRIWLSLPKVAARVAE
jgi:arsenate reductase